MPPYQPTLASLKQHPVPDWFQNAKFGIMVHWSLSSVPGWATPVGALHEVTRENGFEYWFSHNPYAEWYWNTLKIPGSPTQDYHRKTFGADFVYPGFATFFNQAAKKWDPERWADLFSQVCARYVVLVTKHHDGFQLWHSRIPNPFRPDFHSERDVVGELAASVWKRGLRLGLYYSGGPDWLFQDAPVTSLISMANNIPQSPEYVGYVDGQWRELIERYQPSVLWNDIGFPVKLDVKQLYADYYNQVPDGVINDRCLQGDVRWLSRSRLGRVFLSWLLKRVLEAANTSGIPRTIQADFTTPEYATIHQITRHKWETVRGIGYSFGYNQNETADHMLSIEQLIHLLVDVVSKNGNLLLNIGPMADGTIPPLLLERVEGLGRWLQINGEAIFDTRPWVVAEGKMTDGIQLRFTQKGNNLYAILLGKPVGQEIHLPGLRLAEGTEVELLGEKKALVVVPGKANIELPPVLPDSPVFTLKITPLPEKV